MRISTPHSIVAAPVATWLLRSLFGYAVLVCVSLWFPAGLHRVVMGRRDWWHFPLTYVALLPGAIAWIAAGRHPLAVALLVSGGLFWYGLLVKDLFTMWSWHWPFGSIADRFEALNKRFHLVENAGVFVIVALAMALFAQLS
ncbi:hypothetical protein [Burkholderia sp. B21-005]|uniref:hypothetical protein n=1 Tax=Burkholderia sp. B21-005 TaxID=2890406 RepID=UPI001E4D72FD|nr:hypothetical protein [Burkholderia sp. B21-005]UEP40689.1 hypothetical protein LMA02_12715 [Burkholderia sp. B21-005]